MSPVSRLRRLSSLPRAVILLGSLVWGFGAAFLPTVSRAGGLDDLELTPLVSGLSNQVNITHAGDSRLFLVDKGGVIRIWDGSQLLADPFLDISGLVSTGFEQGLLGLAFHPSYDQNGYFFIYYSDVMGDTVIARYEVMAGDANRADPSSVRTLMNVPHFGGHYGGDLKFGPDGYLYFGIGDGGQQQDPECRAQNLSLYQGKILRLDVDQNVATPPYYGVPADNPFVGPGDPADEVWAIGFRNPWRISFDRATGDFYISDVGQFEREEVTRHPAGSPGGGNHGWKVMEGTFCFDPDPIDTDCPASTASCSDPSYIPPSIEYDHSDGDCSITGGFVYRGSQIPSLTGRYLYGDWCTGKLWAASRSGETFTSEQLTITLGQITTFGEDAAGEIYLTQGSTIYRLDGPASLFEDDFESGTANAWSSVFP